MKKIVHPQTLQLIFKKATYFKRKLPPYSTQEAEDYPNPMTE